MAYVDLRKSILRLLASVAAASAVAYALAHYDQALTREVHAQEGPVIHSVEPERPECIVLNSSVPSHRILTIHGENLTPTSGTRLQFQLPGTGNFTILFGLEVSWESAERITVDMGLIRQHLWNIPRLTLQVRVTNARGEGLTAWSDRFNVVRDASECVDPGASAVPTATATPTPFTAPVRGAAGDLWADVVIGKPNFSQIAMKSVVPFKVNNPTGVVVDRSVDPGRAYVWDSGNSRILGIDLAKCYEGEPPCSADIVIGQPSGYDHAACNGDNGVQDFPFRAPPTAETLCGIPDHSLSPWEAYSFVTMAVDGDGNLYVPDSFNHRILKYESPFESDSVADEVWGQGDFSGRVCNRGELDRPTAESLCFHSHTIQPVLNRYGAGVEIDADGNVWVADTGNNRVLRFPVQPATGEIAKTADLVLGQHDFNSLRPGGSRQRTALPIRR